jgi:predicted Rossmann fold flavoprotein
LTSPLPSTCDVAIVGAGAAGLATAIFTRERTARPRVLVIEGARRPGAKILVSGGSRCNVTNVAVGERDFWTAGSRATIRRVLRALPVPDTVAWFASMEVALREEEDGKLFPESNSARDVLNALLSAVARGGSTLVTGTRVISVEPSGDGFLVQTTGGVVRAGAVVLATGGQSLPKSGSDGWGSTMAARLGHTIVPTTPALAPLVLSAGAGGGALHVGLSGISQPVALSVWVRGAVAFCCTGPMLWTHFGVSGPVALDASRHVERARVLGHTVRVKVSFFPGWSFEQANAALRALGTERPRVTVQGVLAETLPAAVARALVGHVGLAMDQRLSQLARDDRRRLCRALVECELPVSGTRGFTFAEATAGGVALDEVDPATMESRVCPGLYLAGEILDVDGRLGGFNFQWAWASARVAARGLVRRFDRTALVASPPRAHDIQPARRKTTEPGVS